MDDEDLSYQLDQERPSECEIMRLPGKEEGLFDYLKLSRLTKRIILTPMHVRRRVQLG